MKKLIIYIAVFLVLGGGLFGQDIPSLTLNAGVNMWWVPFQHIQREDLSIMGTALGRDSPRNQGPQAVIGAIAQNDMMGLRAELLFRIASAADSQSITVGEWLTAWWKPVDFFKLELGNFNNEILWGRIGDSWMKAFTAPMYGNDAIFTRFQGQGGVLAGFNFNNFNIGILIPKLTHILGSDGSYQTVATNDTAAGTSTVRAGDGEIGRVYETVQVGVGYTIEGIGLVRVQYVGANNIWGTNAGTMVGAPYLSVMKSPRIEAAFNLTAIENLNLDIGFKYYIPLSAGDAKAWNMLNLQWEKPTGSEWSTYRAPVQISLGATVDITDDLTFNGRVDTKFLGSFESKAIGIKDQTYGPQINIHLWPTYNLGFATLGVDLGFTWWGESLDSDSNLVPILGSDGYRFGAGLYLEKKWGSWTIAGGLAYSPPTKINVGTGTGKDIKSTGLFSIPLIFDYSF